MVLDAFALAGMPQQDTQVIDFPSANTDEDSIATIKRLSTALMARSEDMARYDRYYRGDHGLRFASSTYREAFGKMFGKYAENVCSLVVDAVEERLDVEGFRFPALGLDGTAPAGEPPADPDAWRIWQDNGLDAKSQIAHTEALVKGVVYVLVSPFDADRVAGRSPKVTIEDPLQTIVEYAAGSQDRVVGLKRWADPVARRTYANLYYPNRVEKWQSTTWIDANGKARNLVGQFTSLETWEHRTVPDEAWPLPHELGVVPLVPLVNRPRLTGEGESEIKQVLPIQDAINKLAVDGLIASDTSAFRQKWATGIEIPKDPETGKDVEPFKPDFDRIIATTANDAHFGNFEASDLSNYTGMLDQKYQSVATISGTPFHYFMQHSGQPPSGDSLRGSETRLTRKANRRARQFGEGWEEVARLAFKQLADERALVLDAETIWGPTETQTESEHIDALGKRRALLKIPLEQLWEDAPYTPGQIAGFPEMLRREVAMLAGTLVEPVAPGDGAQEQVQERVSP